MRAGKGGSEVSVVFEVSEVSVVFEVSKVSERCLRCLSSEVYEVSVVSEVSVAPRISFVCSKLSKGIPLFVVP